MDTKDLGTLSDAVTQIYSLSTVCKEYTDIHYEDDGMLHVGLMVDKINEQALRIKEMLEQNNLLP